MCASSLSIRPVGKVCYSNGMEATQIKILAAAEQRIRTAGYHGFSFREIAADVGIKSSSVHHYFPTKESLGVAVARRYTIHSCSPTSRTLEPQTTLQERHSSVRLNRTAECASVARWLPGQGLCLLQLRPKPDGSLKNRFGTCRSEPIKGARHATTGRLRFSHSLRALCL